MTIGALFKLNVEEDLAGVRQSKLLQSTRDVPGHREEIQPGTILLMGVDNECEEDEKKGSCDVHNQMIY